MKITQITIILAGIAAVVATPTPAPDNGYVEHFREKAKFHNGSLVWFGPKDGHDTRDVDLGLTERATGSTCSKIGSAPECGFAHQARNAECDALVTELNGDGSVSVPQKPRQICYQGDAAKDEYCCVSWAHPVPGLVKADLAGPAYEIEQTCTSNGISGLIRNIQLESVCTVVCLSNRGTDCS